MLIKSKSSDDPKPQPGYEKDGPLEHRWTRIRFGHLLTGPKNGHIDPRYACEKCVYGTGNHIESCLVYDMINSKTGEKFSGTIEQIKDKLSGKFYWDFDKESEKRIILKGAKVLYDLQEEKTGSRKTLGSEAPKSDSPESGPKRTQE